VKSVLTKPVVGTQRDTRVDYLEWNGRQTSGLNAGIDAKVIDVVRHNARSTVWMKRTRLSSVSARQLFGDKNEDCATFADAVELWGKRGTMDMVAFMNTYAVSGYFAIAVNERSRDGKPELQAVKSFFENAGSAGSGTGQITRTPFRGNSYPPHAGYHSMISLWGGRLLPLSVFDVKPIFLLNVKSEKRALSWALTLPHDEQVPTLVLRRRSEQIRHPDAAIGCGGVGLQSEGQLPF